MAIINPGTASAPAIQDRTPKVERTGNYMTHGIDPRYQAILNVVDNTEKKNSFTIVGTLPERFTLTLSAQWADPFNNTSMTAGLKASGQIGAGTEMAANLAMSAAGISDRNKFQSASVWQGGSPISLTVPFIFIAETSAQKDVIDKLSKMMKLVTPVEGKNGIMYSPGPTMLGTVMSNNSRKISVRLGSFMQLSNVVITNVSADVDAMFEQEGKPISMTVNVDLHSYFVTTDKDIDEMLDDTKWKT